MRAAIVTATIVVTMTGAKNIDATNKLRLVEKYDYAATYEPSVAHVNVDDGIDDGTLVHVGDDTAYISYLESLETR